MKYLNSKWTSVKPENNEKHFVIIKEKSDLNSLKKDKIFVIQAVYTEKEYLVSIKDLNNDGLWIRGWK